MSWNPIVAGVDASPEGAWAGAAAWRLAREGGASCHLIHAVPDQWLPASVEGSERGAGVTTVRRHAVETARAAIARAMEGNMPAEVADRIEIRFGRPARVLQQAAEDWQAELVVVGAKRHRRLAQWLAGSTAHDVVRLLDVPTLVATESVARVERVLAAVDLSETAGPVIRAAERLAGLYDAALRVVHVIPQIPIVPGAPLDLDVGASIQSTQNTLEQSVWPLLRSKGAERAVRHGGVRDTIVAEADLWRADLLVVGSHGRGLVDRILLGSVTEGLLRALPTSMLVVPAPHKAALAPADTTPAAEAALTN